MENQKKLSDVIDKIMYTLNTKISEWINNGLKNNLACSNALEYAIGLTKDNPNITFKDGFINISKLYVNEQWICETLVDYDGIFDGDIRKEFFYHIKDPMRSFQLYLTLKNLDLKDEEILSSKFKGLLPNAEKELKDKKIERKKIIKNNGNN